MQHFHLFDAVSSFLLSGPTGSVRVVEEHLQILELNLQLSRCFAAKHSSL